MNIWIKKATNRLKIIFSYSLSKSIGPIGQLIISYIIIKYKSIELWGNYSEVLIWVYLILLGISFGNKDFLLKSFSQKPSKTFQLWTDDILNRSFLLLVSLIILFFIPVFVHIKLLVFIWIITLFISQSYEVLILYHRDFKFDIIKEFLFNFLIILMIYLKIESLDIKTLLSFIILANLIRILLLFFYYLKKMKRIVIQLKLSNLKYSVPFFLPLALGTIRVKIDTYFANSFFNLSDLGKYQLIIGFIGFGQIITTYLLNPYLSAFFRLNTHTIKKVKLQSVVVGFLYAILFTFLTYIVISEIYKIHFKLSDYLIVFLFLIPLLLQMILINQIYKHNLQSILIYIVLVMITIQLLLGYFLLKDQGITGALILKAGSQWFTTLLLWFYFKKKKVI